jgi:predicted transposase YbfD/YdcC
MDRVTEELKTGHTSAERSYYVSNQPALEHERELFDAIRGHWRVESTNWIRDVTFKEDHIRTKHPNQGQILSLLRTVAIRCLQAVHPTNMKATLEKFANVPDS